MTGKRARLATWLDSTGLLRVFSVVGPSTLTVANYHRIRPSTGGARPDFDEGVFGPTVEEFDRQVEWLVRNTNVLSQDDLLDAISGGALPSGPASMITFDDGYIDNYTLAYPVLQRHGAPAVFFVPTGAIEDRQLGWWDLIAYFLRRTDRPVLSVAGRTVAPGDDTDLAVRQVNAVVKDSAQDVSRALLDELAEVSGVPYPTPAEQSAHLMSWEQIREVSRGGIAVGSHTHSHRILAQLDAPSQEEELTRSKAMLEAKLEMPVRSLSYPVGDYSCFTDETKTIAERCGYDLAFSFNTGTNRKAMLDRFDVKRVTAPIYLPLLAGVCLAPVLFVDRHGRTAA